MPRLEVRCSVGEKELWVALAGREGLSLSQWVRSRLSVVESPVVERVEAESAVSEVLSRRFGS